MVKHDLSEYWSDLNVFILKNHLNLIREVKKFGEMHVSISNSRKICLLICFGIMVASKPAEDFSVISGFEREDAFE